MHHNYFLGNNFREYADKIFTSSISPQKPYYYVNLSRRVDFDINKNILVKEIWSPVDWENKFNLYKGSGLGLAHGINQVGAFRPRNYDEEFPNLFYVGASTTPGTGLPMVIISSKLVTERIVREYGSNLS